MPLADAVAAMPWPGGDAYAWGGGESKVMTAIRRYLRAHIGLMQGAVSMTGYWGRTDDVGHDHTDDGHGAD